MPEKNYRVAFQIQISLWYLAAKCNYFGLVSERIYPKCVVLPNIFAEVLQDNLAASNNKERRKYCGGPLELMRSLEKEDNFML